MKDADLQRKALIWLFISRYISPRIPQENPICDVLRTQFVLHVSRTGP